MNAFAAWASANSAAIGRRLALFLDEVRGRGERAARAPTSSIALSATSVRARRVEAAAGASQRLLLRRLGDAEGSGGVEEPGGQVAGHVAVATPAGNPPRSAARGARRRRR